MVGVEGVKNEFQAEVEGEEEDIEEKVHKNFFCEHLWTLEVHTRFQNSSASNSSHELESTINMTLLFTHL